MRAQIEIEMVDEECKKQKKGRWWSEHKRLFGVTVVDSREKTNLGMKNLKRIFYILTRNSRFGRDRVYKVFFLNNILNT